MFKKYAAFLLSTAMLASAAVAEAPQSQFGFTGWPYRQATDCATEEPIYPTQAPDYGENCPDDDTSLDVPATDAPVIPTEAPTSAPEVTAAPTQAPIVTQAPSTDDDYTTQSTSAQEQMMLNLLNNDRKTNGLGELTLDPELSRIARIKSCDMRDNNYFAHESPTYGRVSQMLRTFGYSFSAAGENIAHHANVEKAQAAFMSSDGHRRNILSTSWTKVGIGICYDRNGYIYATQIFVR